MLLAVGGGIAGDRRLQTSSVPHSTVLSAVRWKEKIRHSSAADCWVQP